MTKEHVKRKMSDKSRRSGASMLRSSLNTGSLVEMQSGMCGVRRNSFTGWTGLN